MAEAQGAKPTPNGQTRLVGRVAGVRRMSGQGAHYRTLVRLPAPDQYSSPQTVEVRSDERIGQADDELSLIVQVGGFARSFQGKGEHGEPGAPVRTAENVLRFVAFA